MNGIRSLEKTGITACALSALPSTVTYGETEKLALIYLLLK
jgi:hypothetical protein